MHWEWCGWWDAGGALGAGGGSLSGGSHQERNPDLKKEHAPTA